MTAFATAAPDARPRQTERLDERERAAGSEPSGASESTTAAISEAGTVLPAFAAVPPRSSGAGTGDRPRDDANEGRQPGVTRATRQTAEPPVMATAPADTAGGARPVQDAAPGVQAAPRPEPPRTLTAASIAATIASTPTAGRTVDQVASALALNIREGRTEATLTLRPQALGEVRVRITSGPDGLVIHLSAKRDAVSELLRSRIGELRDLLATQQVAVTELHVLHNPPAVRPDAEPAPWSDHRPARGDEDAPEDGSQREFGDEDETED
jgi:flagellar hook-length control protein FliK